MGDLQELFSRLKAQNAEPVPAHSQASGQPSIWAEPQQDLYQQPSVSSPLFSPPSHTPNPIHSSNIISPVNPSSAMGTPASEQNKTNNLLSLLKSSNASNQGGQSSSQAGPLASLQNVGRTSSGPIHILAGQGRDPTQSRPLSAQDLVASLQRQPAAPVNLPSPIAAAGAEKSEAVTSPSGDSKNFLLNLLNKPKETKPTASNITNEAESAKPNEPPAEDDASLDKLAQSFAGSSITPAEHARAQLEPTPVRQFGSPAAGQTPFEAPQQTKPSMFNYVNPFDQLHSSSPLNRTPKPEAQADPKKFEILKHNRDTSSTLNGESAAPATKSRKLASDEVSPTPSPAPEEVKKSKTVSEALEGVGEKVDKQVEEALKKADEQGRGETGGKAAPADTGDNAADDDPQIKKENVDDDDEDEDEVESSWESAEDDEAQKNADDKIEVYNFPMKPWTSIQIKNMRTPRPIRQDNFMPIANMKKDFDQIDRALVTASQAHIVYAGAATKKVNGGIRIVRQDTGTHKHIFHSTGERMFNVQLCNTVLPDGSDVETVLCTGVNGTLFWTSLAKSRGEFFADDDIEAQGFTMPPVATLEEQTSGSPVKTRAKMSSRHPEYFGVARGKHIHIIAPDTVKGKAYCDRKTRKINSEKYLADHGLRLMTGKAGKDFCFSEDDSMIVSLDKSGRFKFWDIKELTSRASDVLEGKHEPVELREPVWDLSAAASGSRPEEKPSVSSIMFLDKERPTMKGVALRYMLIGFKQNHILQLWDLGLGKAVQEIRLPHEKDSDGICSITYHPRSGIIALGHPTRNSIYFIHLSAPRYGFATMDQAKYINLLARKDPSLPRPDSTAIMSGLREFSFAKVGQLRSLDMLRQPVENASDPDSEDATLFELYVAHSRGVVGIPIRRKDLGWDKDSKMVKPVGAIEAGVIDVNELVPPQKLPPPSETSNAETPHKQAAKPASSKKHESTKSSASTVAKNEPVKREIAPSTANRAATPERASKQIPEAPLLSNQAPSNPPLMTPDSYAMAAQRTKSPNRERGGQDVANANKKVASSPKGTAPAPHVSSNDDLQAMLNKQFEALYQRIDADKRVVDAAGAARQDAMLRLVSNTLTENVEKSLTRIVSENMEKEIVPAVAKSTSNAVEKKLTEVLPQQLNASVSREMKAALPQAIQQALKDPQVQRSITDQVAAKVQQQVSQLLQQSMPNIATQATQKMITDLDNRQKQQVSEIEKRRVNDQIKIQELSELVCSLSDTIKDMSASQAAFQEEILKMQQARSQSDAAQEDSAKDATSAASTAPEPQAEPEDPEVAKITQMLVNGEYDAATIEVRPSLHTWGQ